MRPFGALAAAAALLAGVQTTAAQTSPPLAVEVRGSFAVPTGSWNEDGLLENGFGAGATLSVRVAPQIGLYAGWEWFRFPLDDEALEDALGGDLDGVDVNATDAGFRAGVMGLLPLASHPMVTPFAELGILYNSFEIEASNGENSLSTESDGSVGFEAGVGVAIQFGPRIDVTPSVRYRRHDVEFGDLDASDTAEYFTVGVGLRLRL